MYLNGCLLQQYRKVLPGGKIRSTNSPSKMKGPPPLTSKATPQNPDQLAPLGGGQGQEHLLSER